MQPSALFPEAYLSLSLLFLIRIMCELVVDQSAFWLAVKPGIFRLCGVPDSLAFLSRGATTTSATIS